MRARTQLQIIVLLIPMFFVPTMFASAQGEHNLEWAIQPGDTFNYTINGFSRYPTNNFTYRSYALVSTLPTLSDNVSEFFNMQLYRGSHYDIYFENGTKDYTESYWLAFPIGNLSLLMQLFGNSSTIEFFELSTVFGFASYTRDSSLTRTNTFVFSKSNGVLVHHLLEVYESYHGLTYFLEQLIDGYTPTEVWHAENPKNPDNLYWGLHVGDTINYTYTKSIPGNPTLELDLTVEIIFLPGIPDEITAPCQLLLNEGSLYMFLDNGTELEQSFDYPMTAIAIGNWSLPCELDILTWFFLSGEPEWIDNTQVWGFVVDSEYGDGHVVTKLSFSKTDGALEQYLVEYYDATTRVGYIEMIRFGSHLHTTQTSSTTGTPSTQPSATTTTPVTTTPTLPPGLPLELLVVMISVPALLIVIVLLVKARNR